jgi:hypothetical protein
MKLSPVQPAAAKPLIQTSASLRTTRRRKMVRSPRRHWNRLPTRDETKAKYGAEKLCNNEFQAGLVGTIFNCQILAEHKHNWHIEKGEYLGKPFTMAWKTLNQRREC